MRVFLPLIMAFALTAQAEESSYYDRVMLSVSTQMDVRQEKLSAVLFAEEEGLDTARLADAVNQRIALAMDLAKNEDGVKAHVLGYSSNPFYKKQRVEGWRVRQSLELQSNDPTRLGLLIGKLQSDLNVQSINYSVAEQVITASTEQLIDQAMVAFRQRALRIAETWGRDGYRLVQLAIQDRQLPPQQPMPFQAGLAHVSAAPVVAPPILEGGEQQLSVTITGTIELGPEKRPQEPVPAVVEEAPLPAKTPAQ
jgi:predicted secreted protein